MTTMTRDQVLETVREAQAAGHRADLRGANLTRVKLTGADLAHADLTGAVLTRADLTDAYLTDAYLTDANLTRVNLTNADLIRADLTDANLRNAHLIRADLTGATLTGATLTCACFGSAILTTKQLLDARGLRLGGYGLTHATWDELLPANPQQRRLVEHLLNDGWNGTLREATATVEGLAGR